MFRLQFTSSASLALLWPVLSPWKPNGWKTNLCKSDTWGWNQTVLHVCSCKIPAVQLQKESTSGWVELEGGGQLLQAALGSAPQQRWPPASAAYSREVFRSDDGLWREKPARMHGERPGFGPRWRPNICLGDGWESRKQTKTGKEEEDEEETLQRVFPLHPLVVKHKELRRNGCSLQKKILFMKLRSGSAHIVTRFDPEVPCFSRVLEHNHSDNRSPLFQ